MRCAQVGGIRKELEEARELAGRGRAILDSEEKLGPKNDRIDMRKDRT